MQNDEFVSIAERAVRDDGEADGLLHGHSVSREFGCVYVTVDEGNVDGECVRTWEVELSEKDGYVLSIEDTHNPASSYMEV